MDKVRLDKWLWAARFFRTRSLAKDAIDGGKVHIGGVRAKASRDIGPDDTLTIRQGWDERVVVVRGVTDQRRGAPEAQALYEETADSVARRERESDARRQAGAHVGSVGRPSKKDRRQLHDFKEKHLE